MPTPMPMPECSTEIVVFECHNTLCGHVLKLRQPDTGGVYPVKCPFCGAVRKVRFKGKDKDKEKDKEKEKSTDKEISVPSVSLILGESAKFPCPHCGQPLKFTPQKEGVQEFSCPRCHGRVRSEARARTRLLDYEPQEDFGKKDRTIAGRLILLRRGWLNKNFPLPVGRHTLGRADRSMPSDISIEGDMAMSRRSVVIEVFPTPQGRMFRLTVLNATNPVLHNGTALRQGEAVSLNFGDTLELGHTRFRFDK